MTIQLHSENREAFRLLADALQQIDEYFSLGREMISIEKADELLDKVLAEDANYGLALFYKGMTLDLIGRPADAIAFFERIQNECDSRDLKTESTFNLGVAYYHQYSHSKLKRAKDKFLEVLRSETASRELKDFAKAHLAQTHAMLMRPSFAERQDLNNAVLTRIRGDYDACNKLAIEYSSTDPNRLSKHDRIRAVFSNAVGMSNMYLTDHVETAPDKKEGYLDKAKKSLENARSLGLENDWANNCDLGSVHLRIGVLRREQELVYATYLETAQNHLLRVVEKLRPNYGFALYELGILNRVWKRFTDAREYQDKARKIPVQYRDIGDNSVDKEIERIEKRDFNYP